MMNYLKFYQISVSLIDYFLMNTNLIYLDTGEQLKETILKYLQKNLTKELLIEVTIHLVL